MASETKSKAKNKNKNVNKVKIFLANPLKPKCPSLENEDFQQLEHLLINVIDKSKQLPRVFATTVHICLGLQSSLRAINNNQAACVLLSPSIKPRYLLGLIARNVEVKDQTVSTYSQPQLEDMTQKVFGVKALALVLPKQTENLSTELTNWIQQHRKPKKIKPATNVGVVKRTRKGKKIARTSTIPCDQLKTLNVDSEQIEEEVEVKPWGSSYISFSKNAMDIDEADSEKDESKLLSALDQMSKNVKKCIENTEDVSSKKIPKQEHISALKKEDSSTEEDDFLGDYAPLTVHKVQPNPDRKPRKKRKKNAKKAAK